MTWRCACSANDMTLLDRRSRWWQYGLEETSPSRLIARRSRVHAPRWVEPPREHRAVPGQAPRSSPSAFGGRLHVPTRRFVEEYHVRPGTERGDIACPAPDRDHRGARSGAGNDYRT